jgi:hypothetical protein
LTDFGSEDHRDAIKPPGLGPLGIKPAVVRSVAINGLKLDDRAIFVSLKLDN